MSKFTIRNKNEKVTCYLSPDRGLNKMSLKILGISGSPIPNSNTDRAVKGVLEFSGKKSEFVKLSEINVNPCQACKRCVTDNICKVDDDFPALANKIREAEALVIGAYCPYGMIDANTKAFLERLWSMRHVRNLNAGKRVVIIVTGLAPAGIKRRRKLLERLLKPIIKRNISIHEVSRGIERAMRMENMQVVSTIKIRGNVPCLTCGRGNDCKMSGVPILFGKNIRATSKLCICVEDQVEVWNEIKQSGILLGKQTSVNK